MKKVSLVLVLVLSILALAYGMVLADDVVARLTLDKTVTKYIVAPLSTNFEDVRVSLAIENLSDRIQAITLKPKYHFWLLKVSPLTAGVDPSTFMPIVAEGDLTAMYGKGYPYIQVKPHSVIQEAYGVLPACITKRYTYKGYLFPGVYILRVETPRGLPGSNAYPTTETTLFVI